MKIARLYIRVSTDEQADTGFSQRHQDEMLTRWCEINNVYVSHKHFEDHSAKNFERPEFKKMLMQIRKEKNKTDLLLFTKWDRFSRNAGDAYGMITTLNRLGVEPQAIEQPLDLSIPENKMMLAFYLAAPEVENDRRSLNVATGMRRALKEGRYMGKAPIGYLNKKNEKSKWIEPDPASADIVREVFQDIATGKYSAESVLKFTTARGISCSKNNFWNLLRNPVYCGKILVPAYKGEEAQLVTGQHEPLISEALFYQVQDILDGKKKIQKTKRTVDDRFPLRGFLQCNDNSCSRLLTASASRGRKLHYEYYHCTSSCGTRFPAAQVNEAIITELRKWKPHPAVKVLYLQILQDVLSRNEAQQKQQLKEIQKEMVTLENRRVKARELLLTDSIDPDDYKSIKREADRRITQLEAQVALLSEQPLNIRPQLEQGITVLEHIDHWYSHSTTDARRQILGSIFPEKLVYDGTGFRTARVNEAVRLIFTLGAAFAEKEMGQAGNISDLSHEVIPLGLEPRALTLKVLCSTN